MSIPTSTRAQPAALADTERQLTEAIQRTIAYAHLFDQAISLPEIMRYLDRQANVGDAQCILTRYTGALWHEHDGLYCLPGRELLFAQTRQRWQLAQVKWARARRWARLMAHLPYVRMIAVTGSLAMNNMQPSADIDYLVVTAQGRVWLTRLMLVAVVRAARRFHDELCPNYVLSTKALLISDQNFFVARELAQMVPLFGLDVYQQMLLLNQWSLNYLPAATKPPPAPPEIKLSKAARVLKSLLEAGLRSPLGDRLEVWERQQKIARLQKMPGAQYPNVILTAEQCKGHFRGTHRSLATQFEQSGR